MIRDQYNCYQGKLERCDWYQGKLERLFDVDKFKENKKNTSKKHLISKDQSKTQLPDNDSSGN